MERFEMRYPDPPRNPKRVKAGMMELTVAGAGDGTDPSRSTRTVHRQLYIITTKAMAPRLAQELRSRAHTLVSKEASES